MSTANLKSAIEKACNDLGWINEALARIGPAGTLSRESSDFFQMSPQFVTQLRSVEELLIIRDAALAALLAFPSRTSADSTGMFLYNGFRVTFKVGRYLSFQNYTVTTWAAYDSLAKIAGLLCCTDELSKNPQKPVKLYEDFLQRKNCVGTRVRDHLKGAYGWPISISYKVRNWLAHDGHCHDGTEMFRYDSPTGSGEFELLDEAWEIIEKGCGAEANQTRLRSFPDAKPDLARGLETCHEEADEAMAFLLMWSAGIAKLQASILFPRDAASAGASRS
jgi:hypothetical protein